ncbi:MAG: chromosome segregation protein SMC [Gammaproteobacteria bacterium]|nr:chromosome segregation protein SMC [Gammaproteobacteria bacterium]
MRLKHIKLAGFKSFVDPTKVAFPEQMTCIVGPNGCGKSNVIDAVRWVLGESSAKNLRGDAMTDVIFNGSQARKPVSQASVELVFDNSSGRIQGEFAAFNEISVKRVVTREGQSIYLLNGAKCRRRDITDLFLGTGLGPRSYAIIEQGMISRLIESRPQELRVFIEEAAGISKYKERRKETESRMNRTRDNLERLTDVRDELGQQLAKLQRQAAAAQRYKTLKAQERELKAQLQALRWLHYQAQCDQLEQRVQAEETELQRWVAEQRGSERGQTELREQEAQFKQTVDDIQQQFFRLNTETTRIEQQIQHGRHMQQQRQQQIEHQQRQLTDLIESVRADQEEREQLQIGREDLDLQLHEQAEVKLVAEAQVDSAEEALHSWQDAWQQWQNRQHESQREHALQQAEINAAQQLISRLEARAQAIAHELAEIPTLEPAQHEALASEVAALQAKQAALRTELQQLDATKTATQDQLRQAQQRCAEQRQRSQELAGQISSLNTLLSSHGQAETDATHVAGMLGRLHELLCLSPTHQAAAEQVLAPFLGLPVVAANAPFVANSLQATAGFKAPAYSLAASQQGDCAQLPLLAHFAVAEHESAAQTLLADHAELLAVLLPNGEVLGRAWWLGRSEREGPLQWQQQLNTAEQAHAAAMAATATEQAQCDALEEELQLSHEQREALQQQLHELAAHVAQKQERLAAIEQQQQTAQSRRERLSAEADDVALQLLSQQERIEQAEIKRLNFAERSFEDEPELERLQQRGDDLKLALQQQKQALQAAQQAFHQTQLQHSQLTSRLQHLDQAIQRNQQQQTTLNEHLVALENSQEEQADLELLGEELAQKLLAREEVEIQLQEARERLAGVSEQLHVLNQGQSAVLERIARQQERVQAGKLELASARERGHALLDALQEMDIALKNVLETMPEDAEEKAWQQQLEDTSRKIQQLGAINLAALEEVEVQAERKAYLDAQHEDLTASLTTLEDAIKKIDRETRQRFKATFDQVNSDLQQLFPKVFGGGQAYLDLTEDDLLETGVTIMARPPGKKNSTIHLLSGGEKALTALALVFAIFRLNPAPFCLLDEVDAPLDDVNVGRFCRLVQEMSQSVQFIYISHNKIAMEMALHLAGVTMQEPGVSRLVAVDVEEALAMADA